MNSKWKVALGSVAGACGIHVAFIACSGGGGNADGTDGGGFLDALGLDGLATLIDGETKDAKAADPACCTGIAKTNSAADDPTQWVIGQNTLALADPGDVSAPTKILDGPFVVTYAARKIESSGTLVLYTSPVTVGCGATVNAFSINRMAPDVEANHRPLHTPGSWGDKVATSTRLVIPAGTSLCAAATFGNSNVLVWQGYKPY